MSTPPHSVLALELCLRFEPELHRQLFEVAHEARTHLGLQDKWLQYRRACELLVPRLELAEKGCWDYFDNEARAQKDFKMWSDGMITEEGARTMPSGSAGVYRGEQLYMTFTMAFLLLQNSACDLTMRQVCDVPQHELWHRSSFARILVGMGHLNFAAVEGDVVYLIPGDPTWALTGADLDDPKFEYLRALA